ncbi:hypothetical protein AAFC00_005798 [Neodothiora populina]|uniref:DNA polymerase n=1 Tax=Neodothiora populina TaxID=2781224 RepID=A0ABR3P670_9PEZI
MDSSPSTLKSSFGGGLELSSLPPIFISKTHLDRDDLHDLEDQLVEAGGNLTYDITEAKIILSKAERKRRIELDLRSVGLWTEQVTSTHEGRPLPDDVDLSEPPTKRQKLFNAAYMDLNEGIKVIKVQWFENCLKANTLLPVEDYVTYEGRTIQRPESREPATGVGSLAPLSIGHTKETSPKSILERAKRDAPARSSLSHGHHAQAHRGGGSGGTSYSHGGSSSNDKTKYAHLLHQTTSEYEGDTSDDLPDMPEWVKSGIKYACQRLTPPNPPNQDFIDELTKIKLARLLTNDEIGVRAYSSSIAAIASYPYRISNPREILLIPGCDIKIANLYIEFVNSGRIKAADDAEHNEELQILRLFYNIWGVGAFTAREFFYDRGWRELDDIVEFGWSALSRVQQIGVKYYSEFLSPIPRKEVEDIAAIIHRHAVQVRDSRIQSLVVGGYRRGKSECGDVDIVVSHPEEKETLHIVNDIVASLEDEGWITHTLLLALTNSNREQQTLPIKTDGAGGGFDTLDKALVVWQDPHRPTKDADLAANPKAKNPNIHRRVDIIISPWRTVGCAVAGWSGGTTFQRDLRRYAKNVKGWKFDSSGVRDRGTGKVVDVEGYDDDGKTRATTMEEAERRVFAGFGLQYREPWERCTG